MSDETCIWRGSEHPRAIRGRHLDGCSGDECRGCLPCPHEHCLVCGITHTVGTCPTCLGTARDHLWELWRLHGRLRQEMYARSTVAKHGSLEGVPGGVLQFLLGPHADADAHARQTVESIERAAKAKTRAEREMYAHVSDELDSDGETPNAMLAWWRGKWAAMRGVDAADLPGMDAMLTWAGSADPDFKTFAMGLSGWVTRLEDVLLEGERPETGAPCINCGTHQVREWGREPAEDRWYCPRCREYRTPGEYALTVAQEARRYADKLTMTDMHHEYDINPATLRVWATRGKVSRRGKDERGRVLYDVEEALAARDEAGLVVIEGA